MDCASLQGQNFTVLLHRLLAPCAAVLRALASATVVEPSCLGALRDLGRSPVRQEL